MPQENGTKSQLDILELVCPIRAAKWRADETWSRLERALADMGEDYGGLELAPDFQRGHVWSEAQQTHFIENCLRGVVSSDSYALQFNCPNFDIDQPEGDVPAGLQCLDGLQRYTAITRFVRGEIKAFGVLASELEGTKFSPKRMHVKINMHTYSWRADLLEHYLSLNAGGTPHSATEIERVQRLLAQVHST